MPAPSDRVVVALALIVGACAGARVVPASAVRPAASREVTNLGALARLYGPLRWFSPGDEAAELDWTRFAVLAAAQVQAARTPAELEATLEALVAPIAPTVQILHAGEAIVDVPALHPADPRDLEPVSWQHDGAGLGRRAGEYTSQRRHRAALPEEGSHSVGILAQGIAATPAMRGKHVRLRARVRSDGRVGAAIWLRVDRPSSEVGFFDNMQDRPISATAWTDVEIGGEVAPDATGLVFGALAYGGGTAWFDGVELAVGDAGAWTPVEIANPSFDDAGGWAASGERYQLTLDAGAGRLEQQPAPPADPAHDDADLFADHLEPGAVAEIDLGAGLRARIPLVVWSRDDHTLPRVDPAALAAMHNDLAAVAPGADAATWAADVVVAWSVYAQFYPYFDLVDEDWGAVLDRTLADLGDDRGPADHEVTMRRLVAAADDGHGAVTGGAARPFAPVEFGWVEGQVVVLATEVPGLARGDVVTTLDGTAAGAVLAAEVALQSGSPQTRRDTALMMLGQCAGETMRLAVDRAGQRAEVVVACGGFYRGPAPRLSPVAEVTPGVWYVDLARLEPDLLTTSLPTLAAAHGVVVDMRGYPAGDAAAMLLTHVVTKPDVPWMHTPHWLRPNQEGPVSWAHDSWDLAPAAPHLGHVVFMTGPRAISFAESVLGYAQAEGLPIVGATSAGTNGDVREWTVPSGLTLRFTALRVTRHDGAPHHLRGIAPTIPVEPTLAGVRAGRDEVLERAIVEAGR